MTLVLGFGANAAAARATARDDAAPRLRPRRARATRDGWRRYLRGLAGRPRSASGLATTYDVSVMTLAAHEDKTYRGASVRLAEHAVGVGPGPLEPERRLPQGLGARPLPGRHRASSPPATAAPPTARSTTCSRASRSPTAASRRTRTSTAREKWTNLQLDEAALPDRARVAARAAATRGTYAHVKKAIGCLLEHGPETPQERWENQGGWSPATIASEIAGLVTAADLARANGDPAVGHGVGREGRRVAGRGRRLDRDDQRAVLAGALLPAHHQGRQPERRHDLQHRRLRPRERRPAQGRRPELPRARAPGRQAGRRSRHPQHARRRRPAARRRHAERALLAPLRLRRLRREEGRLDVGHRAARQPDGELGEQRHHRAHLAAVRGRARRVRAGRRAVRGGAHPARGDGRRPRAPAT